MERGARLGCGTVQIFLKNHRQWAARPLTTDEATAFAAARRRSGIRRVFAHASYLLNLAAASPAAWGQSVDGLTDEVERADALGLVAVIVHPGAHMGDGCETGMTRIAAALDTVTARTAGSRVRVVLENTAGAGSVIGKTFAELAALLARARRPERLGVCLDTCHLFVAGHDIRTRSGWDAVVDECARTVGLDNVRAFHVNDARAALGSCLDRHESIGKGQLGLAPFRFLMNDPRFTRVPKLLETPKEPEPTMDLQNLATLRRLRRRRRPGPPRARR